MVASPSAGRFITVGIVGVLLALLLASVPDFHDIPQPLRPHRPFWFSMLNALLYPLVALQLPSLEGTDIIASAEWATGLHDWADDSGQMHAGFGQLGEALKSSNLTAIGRALVREQLQIALQNRLKMVDWRRSRPEVAAQKIEAPVFILGLPRSGTTLLHNLIAQDTERFRSPLTWETQDTCCPPPDGTEARSDPRVWPVELGAKAFLYLNPNIAAVHHVDVMAAEEDLQIMAMDGLTLQFPTFFNTPSYLRWLMEQSQASPLRMMRHFYQHLQSGAAPSRRGRTWLLKTPWHLNHVKELLAEFPDAKIIVSHRDPAGVVGSSASLYARFHGLVTDDVRPGDLGELQLWQWNEVLSRFLKQRAELEASLPSGTPSPFVDVLFKDTASDPVGTVRRVYEAAGWGVPSEKAVRAMEGFLGDAGKRSKHGKHVYELSWFGLSEEAIANSSSLAAYAKAYQLSTGFKLGADY